MTAAEAHRRAQTALDLRVGDRLAKMIAALPAPREQGSMDAYNRASFHLVAGGQHRAGQLALAYLARIAPFSRPAQLTAALASILVTPESPVTRSPILRLWSALAEGSELAEAVAVAGSYAYQLSSNELQVAQRAGLEEGAHASGEEIVGWRKELSPDCCDWCVLVGEDRVYHSPDTVPFHERDSCGVTPVLASESEWQPGVGRVLR